MTIPPTQPDHLVRLKDLSGIGLWKPMVKYIDKANYTDAVITYDETEQTITFKDNGEYKPDGTEAEVGDRVLIINASGTLGPARGIYSVTEVGETSVSPAILTRVDDYNESEDITGGLLVFVSSGTTYNVGNVWYLKDDPAFVLDTTTPDFFKYGASKPEVLTFAIVGDDTEAEFICVHNAGVPGVTAQMYENSTGETVVTDTLRIDNTAIKFVFGAPPATGEDYTVVLSVPRPV